MITPSLGVLAQKYFQINDLSRFPPPESLSDTPFPLLQGSVKDCNPEVQSNKIFTASAQIFGQKTAKGKIYAFKFPF
jgi:hypothetical protein